MVTIWVALALAFPLSVTLMTMLFVLAPAFVWRPGEHAGRRIDGGTRGRARIKTEAESLDSKSESDAVAVNVTVVFLEAYAGKACHIRRAVDLVYADSETFAAVKAWPTVVGDANGEVVDSAALRFAGSPPEQAS